VERCSSQALRHSHRFAKPLLLVGLVVPREWSVLVGMLDLGEDLEDPARLGFELLLHEAPPAQLGVGGPPLSHEAGQDARNYAGSAKSSLASASRAASCSAAFFVWPSPRPSSSPSIIAAHVNRRSCGGPSTEISV
jgi:hypothetical protein